MALLTLGWPKNSEDLDYFYPTDVVTGYDIIFFWVIRVVFSGPSRPEKNLSTVLIHGLARDSQGRKMSPETALILWR
ncbi:MAG: class I tRNA ligase family protein [Clostridium sp.]